MRLPADRADAIECARQQLGEGRERLRQSYLTHPNARRYIEAHSRLIDGLLRDIWRWHGFSGQTTLVAVGGYGRGRLFPGSDIDILILTDHGDPAPELAARIESLIGFLWDIGLNLGHSVRTPMQCLEEAARDITIQTALIEARPVVGDIRHFTVFHGDLLAALDPRHFFKAKRLEQEERYARYQDTPYSLEPNCKESPGGLRDLQTILWITRAADMGQNWDDLAASAFITPDEARQLKRHHRFLRELRVHLHLLGGRREDRLLFEHQEALARAMGFTATPTRRASERLMQAYYRTAKLVTQLNTILLQNIGTAIFPPAGQPPQPLDEAFQVAHELLDVRDEQVFERDPSALLRSFLMLQRHAELKGMTARTLRALWRGRKLIDRDFRASPENRTLFLDLLRQPRGMVHEFRRMNQYGILGRYLPEFGRIVGQMQHDLFHVYTVDQHILQVMRNLRRFTMHEFAHEYPMCTRLIADFERHWLLYAAALYHDIGKGRGGDHSTLGAADARRFCRSHGLDREDAELVEWLVRHHLTLSTVAQKEDISDPDVVRAFAAVVGDERRLVGLYLMTVADIRGTSPKVWNNWKAKLLEDLFLSTRRLLRGEVAAATHGVIEDRQEEARGMMQLYGMSPDAHEKLWRELDTAYFMRHEAEEIAWHARHLHYRASGADPVVKARPHHVDEGLQVMIYAADTPDLFARLCGFFSRLGYSIADAKIHTTRHGYALDSFVLLDLDARLSYRDMTSYIEHELTRALLDRAPPQAPAPTRPSRQLRHFPITPEVGIRPDEKGERHVLSVTAGDRSGLLFDIARALAEHGITLHSAKIATLGERVEDTFLVSGSELRNDATRLALERDLLERLQA